MRIINNKETGTRGFEALYPFKSHYMSINGHQLHYLDEGAGKPVIMVHGNPTWSFYFRQLVTDLSPDFRTIVPDHIGCGFSDKPGPGTYDYTLASRVDDLNTLVERLALKEKITLIVHDWGGMIALAWAIDRLDRIDKLIITNTSGFFLPQDKDLPRRLWLIKYIMPFAVPAVLGFNLFARGALHMCTVTPMSKAVKTGLIAPYNSWRNRIATLKFVQDIPITEKDRSYAIVDHVDSNLDRLTRVPKMFLWGTRDFVFDRTFLNEFQRRFPGSRTHTFNDAGHYLFEDKPHETSGLVRQFLDS